MSKLKTIVNDKDRFREDAKALLSEAMGKKFVSVVIVGLTEEGTVHTNSSCVPDTLKMIGAIEDAKLTLWADWSISNKI